MATVIIPSIGCSSLLPGVVRSACRSKATHVLVMENQDKHNPRHIPTADDILRHPSAQAHSLQYWHVWDPRASLYDMWNKGMEFATDKIRDGVAVILNDDIEISADTINGLIDTIKMGGWAALGADYRAFPGAQPPSLYNPRSVRGSFRHGGIGGFAFAVNANFGFRVDTQFEWWGGDDDLFAQMMQAGYRIGLLDGAWVSHPHPETSAIQFPELGAAKDRDRERYLAKWGESW